MLPPFIIEQIKKREEERAQREHEQQPRLEIEAPNRRPLSDPPLDDVPERGVIILEL